MCELILQVDRVRVLCLFEVKFQKFGEFLIYVFFKLSQVTPDLVYFQLLYFYPQQICHSIMFHLSFITKLYLSILIF